MFNRIGYDLAVRARAAGVAATGAAHDAVCATAAGLKASQGLEFVWRPSASRGEGGDCSCILDSHYSAVNGVQRAPLVARHAASASPVTRWRHDRLRL